ncbi:MAG: hypothetical protein AAGI24_17585 [Pseudomonadota bacterium]
MENRVEKKVTGVAALRRLLWFQFKLALDAVRDFVFSPLSILAFIVDAVLRPDEGKSYTQALMRLGRRSDRVINLFDEYSDCGEYTVDRTLADVETAVMAPSEREAPARDKR